MRRASYDSVVILMAVLLLGGCAQYEKYQVQDSGNGIYATEAIPLGKDEWTICLADRPLDFCPRSRAVFHGYRGRNGNAQWITPNILLIRQAGGKILIKPSAEPIEVAGQMITVRLEYTT